MTAYSASADIPTLSDGDTILRASHPDDADAFSELMNDPVNAGSAEMAYPSTPESARRMIETSLEGWGTDRPYRFTIESPHGVGSTRYAGTVALASSGDAATDIGFSVHPGSRGHGLATAASRLLVDWGFDTLDVPAIRWKSHVGNYASWRVAWRLGFGFDTTLAAGIDHRGEPRDAWVATLGRDDPREPQTTWMRPIRMEADDLVIRDLDPADESRYVEAMTDAESMRWLGTIPGMPRTPKAFREMMRAHLLNASLGQSVGWTVADRDTDEYLASISLFGFGGLDYKSAEVGYRTHPSARGRGVLTRSLRRVIAHAFTPETARGLGIERIHLGAGDGNAGSQGVARSLGFTETGRDRHCYDLADGSVVDLIRFDLLRSEFA